MAYDLTRLKHDGFERLVQALAVSVIGHGVDVFGVGPDGGREATFRGRVDIPGEGPWNGYGVIQAKFKERVSDTKFDQTWFLNELTKELDAWIGRGRARRRRNPPDYLIFVTNVRLTPLSELGGIDRANRIIETYRDLTDDEKPSNKIGLPNLKGWLVWHADRINSLLDASPQVRATFADLILPGDVLTRLYEQVTDRDARITRAAVAYLARSIRADLDVELGESGDLSNSKHALEDVVVDLPVDFTRAEPDSRPTALTELIRWADAVRSPSFSLTDNDKIIVLGGPGTGKSTLSRVLCQIYRCALVQGDSSSLTTKDGVLLAERLRTSFADIAIPEPSLHRFPVLVILSVFADEVARDKSLTLVEHISRLISHRYSEPIDVQDVKRLLSAWPSLIVLDGLDEVPAAESRAAVSERIEDFYLEMAGVQADFVTICTSRPTGYAFDESAGYERMRLVPLTTGQAVGYASRLLESRFPNDEDRRLEVLDRLRVAATAAETKRLMTSPLQITILSLILEQRTQAPASRYSLFSTYYETIYARERNKGGATAQLLERYRRQLNRVHERAGLAIHSKSERIGEADAILEQGELVAIVRHILVDDDGYRDSEVSHTIQQIVDLSKDRLVLLVPHGISGVGFEVRSIAEFFAARCIMASDRSIDELERMIPSAHWRNTWLLAAGYLFAEHPQRRDSVVNRLDTADESPAAHRLVKPGALAALDALTDGFAADAPRFQHQLARSALRVLDSPMGSHIDDLAQELKLLMIEDNGLALVIWEAIDRRLRADYAGPARALLILWSAEDSFDVAGPAQRRINEYENASVPTQRRLSSKTREDFKSWLAGSLRGDSSGSWQSDSVSDWNAVRSALGRSVTGGPDDADILEFRERACVIAEQNPLHAGLIRAPLAEALVRDQIGAGFWNASTFS